MNKEYPFDMTEEAPILYQPKFYNQSFSSRNLINGVSAFHLKTDIINCRQCSFEDGSLSFANMNASLMIVGERPEDVSFETKQGEILAYVLKEMHFNFEDMYRTSVLKSNEAETICHKHIASEVIVVNPLLIICLGELSGKYVIGRDVTMGETATLVNGSDVVVTPRLSDINTQPDLYQSLQQSMQLARNQWEYRINQRSNSYVYETRF